MFIPDLFQLLNMQLPAVQPHIFGNTHVRPDCTHFVPFQMVIERDPDNGLPTAL